jgi:hypothetical protein
VRGQFLERAAGGRSGQFERLGDVVRRGRGLGQQFEA